MDKQVYKGFHPFSYQKDVLDYILERGANRTAVCKARRQCGKSALLTNALLYYSINYPKSRNFSISPTLPQAKFLFTNITEATANAPGLITRKNASDLELGFCNGSTINFKSAGQGERLRGFTSTGLLCIDEAAYIADDIFTKVSPYTDFHKANKLIVSTPFVKEGFFFRLFERGLSGKGLIKSFDWTDAKYQEELNRILTPEMLNEYRATLPEKQFLTEYLGQFIDSDGLVFSGYRELTGRYQITPNDQLFWGLDWALGEDNDDTVLTAINQNREQVYIEYLNNMTPTKQVEKIAAVIQKHSNQTRKIQPETNSLGGVYTDMLKNKLPKSMASKVFGFNTSNESKNALVANLQESFERKTIHILDDEKQLRQLGTYAAEFNPKTRKVSYNALTGCHDDACIALMLANDAQQNYGGSVCLGFV